MSTAETPPNLELVVGEDGSLPPVPAETLAQFGLNRPGAHLRLVEVLDDAPRRKSSRGILKGLIDADAITDALDQNKAERIAAIEREDQ